MGMGRGEREGGEGEKREGGERRRGEGEKKGERREERGRRERRGDGEERRHHTHRASSSPLGYTLSEPGAFIKAT